MRAHRILRFGVRRGGTIRHRAGWSPTALVPRLRPAVRFWRVWQGPLERTRPKCIRPDLALSPKRAGTISEDTPGRDDHSYRHSLAAS